MKKTLLTAALAAAIVVTVPVAGFYTLVKHKNGPDGQPLPNTAQVVGTADFPNLITNSGMNEFAKGSYMQQGYNYCCVGSGNQTPAFTDTQLQSMIAQTSNMPSDIGGANGFVATDPLNMYGYRRWVWRFPDGQAAGNIQEVGIRTYNTNPTADALMSRALVLDVNGQPTSITILSDETLDVFWEIRVYVPTNDVTGTITLEGIDYGYTVRAVDAGGGQYGAWWYPLATGRAQHYSSGQTLMWQDNPYSPGFAFTRNTALVAITANAVASWNIPGPDGTGWYSKDPGSTTIVTYQPGSFYLDRVLNFGLANGNFVGGTGGSYGQALYLSTGMFGGYQIVFDKRVPKNDQKKWTQPFRVSWARR